MLKKKFGLILFIGVLAILPLVFTGGAFADNGLGVRDQLAKAIESAPVGTEPGHIDPGAAPGFLGIPGAPQPSLAVAFLWAIFVGFIFSTIGAFGGILAGVGHITVFGLEGYGKSFRETAPELNRMLTDSIRVSNQWLVGLSAAVGTFNYYRMGRLVLPLGIVLAIGSIAGSYLVPMLTAGKVSLSGYIGFFGLFVFFVGGFLLYDTTPWGQSSKKGAKQAAKAFEDHHINKCSTLSEEECGVNIKSFGLKRVYFTFYGVEFSFSPIVPLIGGFIIAALASFLGVGGGFLFVPFLTGIAGLPMFLVAGTSALTVLVGMIISIFTYMVVKGVVIYWSLIGVELVGVFIGSMLGPKLSNYIPEVWLKRIFVVLALYVGTRYTSLGFLGYAILPPF